MSQIRTRHLAFIAIALWITGVGLYLGGIILAGSNCGG